MIYYKSVHNLLQKWLGNNWILISNLERAKELTSKEVEQTKRHHHCSRLIVLGLNFWPSPMRVSDITNQLGIELHHRIGRTSIEQRRTAGNILLRYFPHRRFSFRLGTAEIFFTAVKQYAPDEIEFWFLFPFFQNITYMRINGMRFVGLTENWMRYPTSWLVPSQRIAYNHAGYCTHLRRIKYIFSNDDVYCRFLKAANIPHGGTAFAQLQGHGSVLS